MRKIRYTTILMVSVFNILFAGCTADEEGIIGGFPYLELDANYKHLSKVGSNDVIGIKTNRPLTLSLESPASWLKAEISGEQIVLMWEDNDLETARQAKIKVTTSNGLVSRELSIKQDASGELTMSGDLILHNKDEIASNTYTKTTGDLIIGNVTSVVAKSISGLVKTDFGDKVITSYASDISDSDIETLNEKIHKVAGGLAIVNTVAKYIPCELIVNNGINRVFFENNRMTDLNPAQQIESLNLKELSLRGNELSDISSLVGCKTIEMLDLSGNKICNIEPLKSMSGLKKVILQDLPLTNPQIEIFQEQCNAEIVVGNLRPNESNLPIFGEMNIVEVSDTEVQISIDIIGNSSNLRQTGFYVGSGRKIKEMNFYEATRTESGMIFTYNPETLNNKNYYVRAYAANDAGGAWSEIGAFGRVVSDEDIYIRSDAELQSFADKRYSYVNSSVLVGNMTSESSEGILLKDEKFDYIFKEYSFYDLSILKQLIYVRDGLYIGNAGVTNLDIIDDIEGIQTLWLKANKIVSIPKLKSDQTLKSLNVSMNLLTDFSFLERMPLLEKLYLGSSDMPEKETNDIGIVEDLHKYTNLRYIDLSGLPLHDWQVEELRKQMPGAEIVFVSGNRDPYIPTVVPMGIQRMDSKAILKGVVSSSGRTSVTEYGFYFGKSQDDLEKIIVGSSIKAGSEYTCEVSIPDKENYYFMPYAVNSYGESRTSASDFNFASVDLSQYGTANCYIVRSSGDYMFDASVKGNSKEIVGPASYAEVLWETKNTSVYVSKGEIVNGVEYKAPYVKFTVPDTFTPGNALIAVKDRAGTILWSWHIWVSDYDPDETSCKYISGAVMMDRNLGALDAGSGPTAYGFLYQWGRKDPLMGSANGGTSFATTNPSNIKKFIGTDVTRGDYLNYSIKNPTHLIERFVVDTDSWSSEKTKYDPCPVGWRVPDGGPGGVWKGFVWGSPGIIGSPNSGHFVINPPYSDPASIYPSPGYTDGGRLELYFPNSAAYSWACTSTGNQQAYSMTLYNRVETELKSFTWSEFSVRCQRSVRDLTVQTLGVVSESDASITVKGHVDVKSNAPVLERGLVVAMVNRHPTLNGNDIRIVCDVSEAGDFQCTIEGIRNFVRYYIRAYAIGRTGIEYGDVVEYSIKMSGSGEGFTGDDFEL